ncbi:MAG TPA: hypothetical protein VFU12_04870 [Glycomyces sp.]|nr:hypothetical protein [Glycomyces sp.]
MTRAPLRSRLVRAGAAAALAAAAAPAWASPAGAQDGGCEGVAVVVDSGRGDAAVGCAEDPSTGIEALAQAGFAVVEVGSFPGAVCRIEGFPETDCGPMPPADASWTYWYADADGEWTYSSVGAHMRDPDAGDADGWVFGSSEPPALAPAEALGSGAAETTAADADASEDGGSPTWMFAVAALAVIAGLVAWRLRRDRRA